MKKSKNYKIMYNIVQKNSGGDGVGLGDDLGVGDDVGLGGYRVGGLGDDVGLGKDRVGGLGGGVGLGGDRFVAGELNDANRCPLKPPPPSLVLAAVSP